MKLLLFLIPIFIFSSCHRDDINDKSKRNENWEWWVDASTGKGEWIHLGGDSSTVKNGRFTTFYFNGEKYEEGRKVNGKIVDTLFEFNLKGQLDCYATDSLHETLYFIHDGYKKQYDRDGTLLAETDVKNHKFYGILINYYKNGNKRFVRNYIKDSGWITEYYENGQRKDSLVEFNNSNAGKLFKSWFENGQVKLTMSWNMKTGLQEGVRNTYSENDTQSESVLERSSNWKNGLQDGVTIEYYPNSGKIYRISNWKDSVQNGLSVSYYESGRIKDSVYVFNDKLNGSDEIWYEDGKLKFIGIYKNDQLVSGQKYSEDGSIIFEK
jgi:antitoxin component YwqK of YwqJK toxin-antitoxin module